MAEIVRLLAGNSVGLWQSGLCCDLDCRTSRYSRSPRVGKPIAAILKSNVEGMPALFVLNPVSNFVGFIIMSFE